MHDINSLDKALTPQQERVAVLLASGCSKKQVADATGFSLGYISQLCKKDAVKDKMVEVSSDRMELDLKRKNKYDKLEVTLLNGIRERAATGDMSELTRALDVVSKHNPSRQVNGMQAQNAGEMGTVTVSLPAHILGGLSIQTNARNEVIEVDGQSMLPLTPKAIEGKLNGINNE